MPCGTCGGKIEDKPVWKLLIDMSPDEIISLVDFTHLSDVLTPEEARAILAGNEATRLSEGARALSIRYSKLSYKCGMDVAW